MTKPEVVGSDWSSIELDLIVADYFAMLKEEQAGQTVRKTDHRRALKTHIQRTDGSIEFKHQNISAVLTQLGLPRIRGYVPARNFQGAIVDAIGRYLELDSDPVPLKASRSFGFADTPSLFESTPPAPLSISPTAKTAFERVARKFDPALRDQLNRALGLAGEELIYEREKQLLIDADRKDLARKVRWVSREDGDGAGYDIRSYDMAGAERWIEVKTTRGGSTTPFYLTRNENEVAKERPEAFRLYRLHDFSQKPGLFTLTPPLEALLQLEALTFRASLK
ncbi:DUF3883 domain-containing protein [Reyranella sp.]|uniref:DUF3883 domain-containing protein n=1 Tax=Reyranella sp. TaxID=1929291 RepID=UPI003F6E7006